MNGKKIVVSIIFVMVLFLLIFLGNQLFFQRDNIAELFNGSFPEEISMVTVTGIGLESYDSTTGELKDGKIVLEQKKEIDIFLEAIKQSSFHSGPLSDIGENFQLTFSSKEGTSKTIFLWLYPERNYGRIQEENGNGKTYLLSEDNVRIIAELLNNKK